MHANTHNALNDFTDRDAVQIKYKQLWENHIKLDPEVQKAKDLNRELWHSVLSLVVLMLAIVLFATVLVIGSNV